MDSTRRIADRNRPAYHNTPQTKINQTTEAVVSVSEDRSVTEEKRDQVGGVAADRKANLNRYKELLDGRSLPTMTQLMGAQEEEESVARKALEKPSLSHSSTHASVDSKEGSTGDIKATEESEQSDQSKSSDEKSVSGELLTQDEQKEVEKLKQRDREVRNHEQAHVAAGGQYVRGGIKYDYQRGPDGRTYAVGGHVNIDVSEARTPQATIVKMQQVKRAALAPAEPSGADRAVAAEASQKEQRARTELLEDRQEQVKERQSKVSEHGESARNSAPTQDDQADSTSGGVDQAPEIAQSDRPSEIEAPDTPQARNHMSLAREARLRIKHGVSWMA